MTKSEFVELVQKTGGYESKKEAQRAVKAFEDAVTEALTNGNDVVLPGFGTFKIGHRAARKGRNPQTGEEMQIAAAKTVRFRVGKNLRDLVNG